MFQECWCLGHLSQVPDFGSESPEPSESVRIKIKICSIKSRVEASGFLGLRCGRGLMLVQSFIVWVKGLGCYSKYKFGNTFGNTMARPPYMGCPSKRHNIP